MPTDGQKQSLLQRLANVLVYIIAFPFIAIFIALKRVFTEQKGPSRSYRSRLPEMHSIGGDDNTKPQNQRPKDL
jgi:hypothetical protein